MIDMTMIFHEYSYEFFKLIQLYTLSIDFQSSVKTLIIT